MSLGFFGKVFKYELLKLLSADVAKVKRQSDGRPNERSGG